MDTATTQAPRRFAPLALLMALASACAMPVVRPDEVAAPALEVTRDCAPDWEAVVALDTAGVGIWTVFGADVADDWGGAEVIAADDEGRAWLLIPYSGRWTTKPAVHDSQWLGALSVADIDPHHPGRELIAGGEGGRLYLVEYHLLGGADVTRIAEFPGEEIHTVIAADFDRSRPGLEIVVFTSPGMAYLVSGKEVVELGPTAGRVRDVLELDEAGVPTLLTASRSGALEVWTFADPKHPDRRIVGQLDTGIGRLSRGRDHGAIFAGSDDGRVLRIDPGELHSGGPVALEVIHTTALGIRGVAAGRFTPGAGEQVAVCGYDGKVRLLARLLDGSWSDTVVYDDEAKLHWLSAVELDGRNQTDELLCSGYGGRVVLLRRKP